MAQYTFIYVLFLFSTYTFRHSVAQMVPAVFVFGDSLLDVGNNNYLNLSFVKINFPHNGIDFTRGEATGRFSNGKNAADFLADKLGLPTSPPYLSITETSNKTKLFLSGISFASGGAGILDSTENETQVIPLSKQIEYYTRVHSKLVQHMGKTEAQKYFSKSLYSFAIGSNDLGAYYGAGFGATLENAPTNLLSSMTITLTGHLKTLYNLGARKFVVFGNGNIGCCPGERAQYKTGECNKEYNYWLLKFNKRLTSLLRRMKTEHKDINYAFLDSYGLFLNVIEKPAEYGFTEAKAACCGLGNLNAEAACLPTSNYCTNRTNYVFWDWYHPTEAAAKLLIDYIFDGSQKFVYPVNVRQLVAL